MDQTRRLTPLSVGAGRYRLDAHLGGDGLLDTYLAMDTQLGRPVEVTLLAPGGDPAVVRRFSEETRRLAGLDHPGLVAVYDFGAEAQQLFLVTALIEAQPLRSLLARRLLPATEAMTVGAQVAEVLAYVHGHGIAHRNIMPSNVLIGRDGRGYLTRFGLSWLVHATRMMAPGAPAGAAAYLAPEQVQGIDSGPAGDVYSLGLVLLQCVTGRLEYPGSGDQVDYRQMPGAPAIPGQLPSPLGQALTEMTQPDPAARPTAAQCAAMLAQPDLAEIPKHQPPQRRSKALRNWAIAGAVVLLAVLIGASLLRDEPTEVAEPQPGPAVDAPSAEAPGPGPALPDSLPDAPGVNIPEAPSVEMPDLPEAPPAPELPEVPETDGNDILTRIKEWFQSWT